MIQQELDRSEAAIFQRFAQFECGFVDLLAEFRRKTVGRRLFDQLLPAALDGAFAFTQADHIPFAVPQDLHLDVAGLLDQRFEKDGIVIEGCLGFTTGCFDHGRQFRRGKRQADTAPAAARRSLDQHRVLHLFGHIQRQYGWQGFVRTGDDRQAGFAAEPAGRPVYRPSWRPSPGADR